MKSINMSYLFFWFFTLMFATSCRENPEIENDIIKVQRLAEFQLDGDFSEWESVPLRILYADPLGNSPQKEDLTSGFKIAWNDENLLLYFEIEDDRWISDTVYPWNGDAVEIFMMDRKGSENIVQFSVVTGEEGKKEAYTKTQDYRKLADKQWVIPKAQNRLVKQNGVLKCEMQINYKIFGAQADSTHLALQVYVNDSDEITDPGRNQMTWYPMGHSYMNSFAAFSVELTEDINTSVKGTARAVITDNNRLELFVFGTQKGDIIHVVNKRAYEQKFQSASNDPRIPERLRIPIEEIDLEKDTLTVRINDELCSRNDLFLAPRRYRELKPENFEGEIKVFLARDRLQAPDSGGVLFIGSSSIRMWTTIYRDFPELDIIHRGFGGSNSYDALHYIEQIVLPYKPSVVVYYEGDNDIPQGLSADSIISNTRAFIERILLQDPDTRIYLISPKPSIARMHLWDKYLAVHERMETLAAEFVQVSFVNMAKAMFENGKLREDLFIEDKIHMNEKGYDIWTGILRNEMNIDQQR